MSEWETTSDHNDSLKNDHPNFIQWKGTDICIDVYCPKCNHHSHYDGYFAHYVECAGCGTIWQLECGVKMREWVGGQPYIQPLKDVDPVMR